MKTPIGTSDATLERSPVFMSGIPEWRASLGDVTADGDTPEDAVFNLRKKLAGLQTELLRIVTSSPPTPGTS